MEVKCPDCGNACEVDDDLGDDLAKCSACGLAFAVEPPFQEAQTSEGETSPEAAPVCRWCGAEMAVDAVMCMACGYNTRTGRRMATDVATDLFEAGEGGETSSAKGRDTARLVALVGGGVGLLVLAVWGPRLMGGSGFAPPDVGLLSVGVCVARVVGTADGVIRAPYKRIITVRSDDRTLTLKGPQNLAREALERIDGSRFWEKYLDHWELTEGLRPEILFQVSQERTRDAESASQGHRAYAGGSVQLRLSVTHPRSRKSIYSTAHTESLPEDIRASSGREARQKAFMIAEAAAFEALFGMPDVAAIAAMKCAPSPREGVLVPLLLAALGDRREAIRSAAFDTLADLAGSSKDVRRKVAIAAEAGSGRTARAAAEIIGKPRRGPR